MTSADLARQLYRIIKKHVRGEGSQLRDFTVRREALRSAIPADKLPPCVAKSATLATCNKYLAEKGGKSQAARLRVLDQEFAPLLGHVQPPPPPPAPEETRRLIFISHSHADAELAAALIKMLRAALDLKQISIRCTSVPGYKLTAGELTDQILREEVLAVRVFLALVTPASLRSTYVLFELGARWGIGPYVDDKGQKRPLLLPVLAGVPPNTVPRPLSNLHLLELTDENELLNLVSQIGDTLGRPLQKATEYSVELKEVAKAALARVSAVPRELTKKERRILRALLDERDGRYLSRYRKDDGYEKTLATLQSDGLVEPTGGRLKLTRKGEEAVRAYLASTA